MTDKRNIPAIDQSWSSAEKMLDRHFRKKRMIVWIFSIVIPAMIAGLVFVMNQPKKSVQENMVAVETTETSDNADATQATDNTDNADVNEHKANVNSVNVGHDGEVASASNNNIYLKKAKIKNTDVTDRADKNEDDIIGGALIARESMNSPQESSSPATDNLSSFTSSKNEEIALLSPFAALFSMSSSESSMKQWESKKYNTSCMSTIGYELSVYGGASYVQKSLSVEEDEFNYLQHRQNEEDPIVTPMVGLAVSANMNGLKLSAGFEFSSVGEETNYYPYSNQLTITDNSNWQLYLRSIVDTDTAYVMGNQYFMRTTIQMQDSSYITDYDSSYDYKYDQHIAETNGVNHIYYVEMPIMLSYCLNKGRFGFGVSGGLSPAMQISEKGYYLRKDGRGVESLEEIKTFRKFIVNGRVGVDFYYRAGSRTMLMVQPLFKANLNSVFEDDYGVNQKYYSTGVLFGVSYMLN